MNGAAPSTTSSGPRPSASAALRAAALMLPWVRTAPFGRPDVPEVKRITAGSSSLALDDPGVRSTAAEQPSLTNACGIDGAHALLDLWRGEQDVEWHDDRAGSRAPKNAATNAGEFGSLSATRSPGLTPRAASAAAASVMRRSSSM